MSIRGRGTITNPPNRFEEVHREPIDIEWSEGDEPHSPRTTFYPDHSKSILAKNDSPDIPFDYSLNPYRGCEHGCAYCYARPSHEYLGFSAGLDFETKIMVKLDAPALLDETFRSPRWKPQIVSLSGNTDCYQPIERKLTITRRCLEVFLKYRNPVGIITKNFLVTRDLDILRELASLNAISVMLSITSLNDDLIRAMEPRTSTPLRRLEAIERLSSAGIPVGVNVAPIIPGLNDAEMPAILKEAAARGAKFASYIIVRLPGPVRPLFLDWIERTVPERRGKILANLRDARGGKLSESAFGKRMRAEGPFAESIRQLFHLNCRKLGLGDRNVTISTEHFRRDRVGQLGLFGET